MAEQGKRALINYIRTNGIDLAYETFGESSSPPFLLIMGLSSQMIMWEDEFCERLSGRGYYVIRFDNRDVGLSSRLSGVRVPDFSELVLGSLEARATVPYTLRDMAADTIGLLDGLNIDAAHVAGMSMGGMIAQEMAIHFSGRLRTLTSIMSTTSNPLLPPPEPEALEVLFKPVPTSEERYVEYFVATWKLLNGPEYPVHDETTRSLAKESFKRGISPAASARQIAAIMASGSRKEALSRVRIPALVIHGDRDPLVPVACGLDTAEAIPGAKRLIFKGMGHALPRELWDEIISAMAGHAR
ncbi:MAG TPA: alpha/beta hydrolase [Deltaproteobacteria bacterium]|nr:alpha/beta hydrolase [Deltaproteobacteria bacterium]